MDKNTFLQKIKDIGVCESDVDRRTMLSELEESMGQVFDQNEQLTTTNQTLTADNETLRSANMKLFLRVGERDEPEEKPEPPKPKIEKSYAELFNEK